MKLKTYAVSCLLASGLVAGLQAQDIKLNIPGQANTSAPATPSPATPAASAPAHGTAPAAPAATYSEAQMLETYGWFIGKRVGLSDLDFTADQVAQVLKGITSASYGKPSPFELEKIGPQMDAFIKTKQADYMAKLRQKGLSEAAAFFTQIKKKAGVTVLPSGLVYEIIKPGTGPSPKATDTVTVNYTGTLVDGTVFGSTVQQGTPVEFPLQHMIPGFMEGLQKANKGSTIRLYIPPDLAFGDQSPPGIPPSSALVFEVELIDFKDTPPEPTEAAAPAEQAKPSSLEANPAAPGK